MLYLCACQDNSGWLMHESNEQKEIITLLGIALPSSAQEIRFFRWHPDPELAFFTAYIKFHVSHETYIDFINDMEMSFLLDGGDALVYLPTVWDAEPELNLEWWTPSSETPEDAAAKAYGINGWIVGKYELGDVYLIVTDSGYFEK
jgi:hypothetical protein